MSEKKMNTQISTSSNLPLRMGLADAQNTIFKRDGHSTGIGKIRPVPEMESIVNRLINHLKDKQ